MTVCFEWHNVLYKSKERVLTTMISEDDKLWARIWLSHFGKTNCLGI